MEVSIAFSPCPNDTFIFDALVHQKIDTNGIRFKYCLEDVESLNKNAITAKYDVSKVSFGVYPSIMKHYSILDSGSALGMGVGPLLISGESINNINIEDLDIAIPGEHTTAHFLFSMAYPHAKRKIFMRYDEIENFVLRGMGLGVIIHENRFTFQEKGLRKILDLGEFWERQTALPIPLGGIVIKRSFQLSTQQIINNLIRKSVEYAYSNDDMSDFVMQNAQEMSYDVMKKHIDLYVNQFTLSMGESGKEAVQKMLSFFNLNDFDNFSRNVFMK